MPQLAPIGEVNQESRRHHLARRIGITPFRSMVFRAAKEKLPHRIFLFYSNRRPKDAASPIYYVAGPPEMVKGLHTVIHEAGIDDDDIRTEEFAGY